MIIVTITQMGHAAMPLVLSNCFIVLMLLSRSSAAGYGTHRALKTRYCAMRFCNRAERLGGSYDTASGISTAIDLAC